WAASYIKTAAQNKWITGYLDGTYRPGNYLKLEEAATAALKLLGYLGSDFSGSYPNGQLALCRSLGLSENVTAAQGGYMTRGDCLYLIYNLLTVKNKDGKVYIETLGYTVNSSGGIDYTALINKAVEGPVVVGSGTWYTALPFSLTGASFYRNGTKCASSSISLYDVIYYSLPMRTVWAYNNKVTGTYEAASPNSDNPASVTVAGTSYNISSSSAAYALSDIGGFSVGDTVTLLLGRDKTVVGVIPSTEANSDLYGVVTKVSSENYTDANGKSYSAQALTIADTSGAERRYVCASAYYSAGDLVKIGFSGGETAVSPLQRSSLTGTVTSSGIGGLAFSGGAEILDVSGSRYARLFPSRLAGIKLEAGDVYFYSTDINGEIDRLILNNVTNDMQSFGIIESVESSSDTKLYTVMINGKESKITAKTGEYLCSVGGCVFSYDGDTLESVKNMTELDLSGLNESYVQSNSASYPVSDKVAVYVKDDSGYNLSSISAVSDLSKYTLRAYLDKPASEGGRVRVIVAEANR
ncbi:MAG: S-layer homology domain-containing protein, partial [Bacillota bacterium]|nr:S-layer homology domain-containing protein [Bacillota bacterium]